MRQKTMIDVISEKPLEKMGNNTVLVYDKEKNCYKAMTHEQLLAPQNEKIKALTDKFAALSNEVAAFKQSVNKSQVEFKQSILDEKQEFLKTYKETNEKIIKMVKSFTNEEGV